MTKEGRVVALALTTIFMYGLSMFLTHGTFIFPFPLNEVIFFIATLLIGYESYKSEKLLTIFFGLFAISKLFSGTFIWSFFTSHQVIEKIANSPTTDISRLLSLVLVIILFYLTFKKGKGDWVKNSFLIPTLMLTLSAIFSWYWLEIITFGMLFIFALYHLKSHKIFNLWILLFVLELVKFWHLMV